MSEAISQFHFTHNGRSFIARVYHDDLGAPWKEHDGHAPVREVQSRGVRNAGKRPGERVLYSNGHTVWLYDWQAACKMARADGWDAEPYEAPGRVNRAVLADFNRLRGWLTGTWHWVGVGVVACDESGEFADDDSEFYGAALWGIESDSPDYHREVAQELADQLRG